MQYHTRYGVFVRKLGTWYILTTTSAGNATILQEHKHTKTISESERALSRGGWTEALGWLSLMLGQSAPVSSSLDVGTHKITHHHSERQKADRACLAKEPDWNIEEDLNDTNRNNSIHASTNANPFTSIPHL